MAYVVLAKAQGNVQAQSRFEGVGECQFGKCHRDDNAYRGYALVSKKNRSYPTRYTTGPPKNDPNLPENDTMAVAPADLVTQPCWLANDRDSHGSGEVSGYCMQQGNVKYFVIVDTGAQNP